MYRCEALTPEALASIASMVDLRELYINRTHVNDNVLDCYQNLVNLRKLCFGMGDPAVRIVAQRGDKETNSLSTDHGSRHKFLDLTAELGVAGLHLIEERLQCVYESTCTADQFKVRKDKLKIESIVIEPKFTDACASANAQLLATKLYRTFKIYPI